MSLDMLPFSVRDAARLTALDGYDILDTPPEQSFDDVVQLACQLCATPIALVSLIAGDRQWFKARVNFPACETDLNSSVCAYTLAEPDVLVIPDLAADERTRRNPLVTGDPFIRFYAGAPLRMPDGQVLGSLCVIDHRPRADGLKPEQIDSLRRLARQVVNLIGLRGAVSDRDTLLAQQHAELQRERRLELLTEASATLLSAADPAAELLALLDHDIGRLGFEQSYACMASDDGRFLSLIHTIGAPAATREALRHVAVDVPLAGIVAQTGQPLIVGDLQSSQEPRHQIARATGSQAFAGYPVTSRGRVRGVIAFLTTDASSFDAETLAFFAAIARLLSIAQERLDDERHLRESEERLNLTFQASATIGWWDWDVQPDRLIANARFAELIGADPSTVAVGMPVEIFWRAVHPEDRGGVESLVRRAMESAGPYLAEYRLLDADGDARWVVASGRCYDDAQGAPARFPGILTDVTAAKMAARRQEAMIRLGDRLRDLTTKSEISGATAEIIGEVLGLSRAGYCTVDAGRETVEVERDWMLPGLASIAGCHGFRSYGTYLDQLKRGEVVLVRDVRSDPRTAGTAKNLLDLKCQALFNLPIMERGAFVGLLFALDDRPRSWTDAEVAFLREVADRARAAIGRAEAEEHQRLLNDELSHRLKNTLAMVQSIAAQTLRTVVDRAPVETFERRVHALASAHEVLLKTSWTDAPLSEIARGVLQNSGLQDRVTVDGPVVHLGARASLSLSLVLHELITNAGKYGALSTAEGRVDLSWTEGGIDEDAELVLLWRECGGPPVVAPTRRGFGSKLIRLGMVGAGRVELRYLPEGFQAEMRASLQELQQS